MSSPKRVYREGYCMRGHYAERGPDGECPDCKRARNREHMRRARAGQSVKRAQRKEPAIVYCDPSKPYAADYNARLARWAAEREAFKAGAKLRRAALEAELDAEPRKNTNKILRHIDADLYLAQYPTH